MIGVATPGTIVSSGFLMVPEGRSLCTFSDCVVVPEPNTEQLAQIAITAAQTHQELTDEQPVVAMLSFRAKGSADHETVFKVREATRLAQSAALELLIDGEMQFDAAWVHAICVRKAPESPSRDVQMCSYSPIWMPETSATKLRSGWAALER